MATHDNDETTKNQIEGGNPQQSTMDSAFQQAGVKTDETVGGYRRSVNTNLTVASIGKGRFRRSYSRAETSEVTVKFEEAYKKKLQDNLREDASYPVSYNIATIDRTDSTNVGVSAILTTGAFELSNERHMVVYATILEGSTDGMAVREENIPGLNKPVEVQLTAGEYAVESFWEAIVEKLTSTYGDGFQYHSAGVMTIPRAIDPEQDEHVVRESQFIAIGALDTYIETNFNIGADPLTVQVVTNHASTQIIPDLNDVQSVSAAGLPVRNDMSLTLRSLVKSEAMGVPDTAFRVVSLSGYVNLQYTTPPPPTMANQRPDTRRFTPQFVITGLNSETDMITMETQLLAVSMAPLLDYNDQYLAPLMPSATQNHQNRDFGAVGYEVNLSGEDGGEPLGKEDLKSMSTAEIFKMARMSIFDNLHVALLVDESGPLSWMNGVFVEAANGSKDAQTAIIQSANTLTGGTFDQFYNVGEHGPIAMPSGNRVHLGYYKDKEGNIRDLMDIDYLWVLNRCGAKNIDLAYRYGDTLFGNEDPVKRLADRWNIITQLVPSATLVSYGQIVEFGPQFLTALMSAVKAAGLNLRTSNSLVDFQNARGRSSYTPGRGLDSSIINSTLNQGGGDNRMGNRPYAGMGMNSWRRY